MLATSNQMIIRRLRLRSCNLNPLIAQLRLANALNAAQLRPTGFGPAAILIIHHLPDPLPGRLSLDEAASRPPPAWERAVTASLDSLARDAARPVLEAVPANAAAVVFADHAEWLACLASDWCAGTVLLHWWWQGIVRHTTVTEAVKTAWLESPVYLPSALGHLAARHEAVPFVRRLDDKTTRILLQEVAHYFALPGLVTQVEPGRVQLDIQPKPPPQSSLEGDIHAQSIPGQMREGKTTPLAVLPPPWSPWVPESADLSLSSIQQLLLGVGLLLQRKPAITRAPAFLQAVQTWWQTAVTPNTPPSPRLPISFGQATTRAPVESIPLSSLHYQSQTVRMQTPSPPQPQIVQPHTPAPQQPQVAHPFTPSPSTWPEATLETAWGGLFYLVNVGLSLGLYGDFTTPLQPGISLPIWDFLALLSQELVGEAIQSDPVWPLLAQLSGRLDLTGFDNLSGLFAPPMEWRLPPGWLAAFPEPGIWQYTTNQGRLRVLHPAGFQLLDLPLIHHSQVTEETHPYTPHCSFTLQPGSLPDEPASLSPLQRWLNWLMPYMRARLGQALGETANLPHLLCHHDARLYLTDTHLDIFLSLDELPVAIRLAGLDRDPGWVPAAGRYIKFHFE